jgi:hypothetical protein
MADLTPEQQAAQQKLAEARAARIAAKVALKAKQDALRANIGKTFSNGEQDAKVVNFEVNHYSDGIWGESFVIELDNPNHHTFRNCEMFLAEFQLKGAP